MTVSMVTSDSLTTRVLSHFTDFCAKDTHRLGVLFIENSIMSVYDNEFQLSNYKVRGQKLFTCFAELFTGHCIRFV